MGLRLPSYNSSKKINPISYDMCDTKELSILVRLVECRKVKWYSVFQPWTVLLGPLLVYRNCSTLKESWADFFSIHSGRIFNEGYYFCFTCGECLWVSVDIDFAAFFGFCQCDKSPIIMFVYLWWQKCMSVSCRWNLFSDHLFVSCHAVIVGDSYFTEEVVVLGLPTWLKSYKLLSRGTP